MSVRPTYFSFASMSFKMCKQVFHYFSVTQMADWSQNSTGVSVYVYGGLHLVLTTNSVIFLTSHIRSFYLCIINLLKDYFFARVVPNCYIDLEGLVPIQTYLGQLQCRSFFHHTLKQCSVMTPNLLYFIVHCLLLVRSATHGICYPCPGYL